MLLQQSRHVRVTRSILESPPSRPVTGGHEPEGEVPKLERNRRAAMPGRVGLSQVNHAKVAPNDLATTANTILEPLRSPCR